MAKSAYDVMYRTNVIADAAFYAFAAVNMEWFVGNYFFYKYIA
jgi:hypothetical protein